MIKPNGGEQQLAFGKQNSGRINPEATNQILMPKLEVTPDFKVPGPSQDTNLASGQHSAFKPLFPVVNKEEDSFLKSAIKIENEQIIESQKKNEGATLVNGKNQNYTVAPVTSPVMSVDLEAVSKAKEWDGSIAEVLDEDTVEELNMPEINKSVIKTVFDKN